MFHSRKLVRAASEAFARLAHHGEQQKTLSHAHIRRTLRDALLRATRQRIALMESLVRDRRHRVTAEAPYSDVSNGQYQVSSATVSSTLRRLEQAGVVKRIIVPGTKKAWFVIAQPI